MARKARLEIEGGLYHVITRGNDRQDIFHSEEDFAKFLTLLAVQKEKMAFHLYAFCLMTNHIHLLIERQHETVGGRIMQRVLTGYSQWYNRKYRHVGHVFQGRHKSILCQSDAYLAELVRYIHLNPVRAKMVGSPEDYPYSSHREYLVLTPVGITDVDPLLRRFGPKREIAAEHFHAHVLAGIDLTFPKGIDSPLELQTESVAEFVDDTIHRIGKTERRVRRNDDAPFHADAMLAAVMSVLGVTAGNLLGPDKAARVVFAKEVLILAGLERGATRTELSGIIGIDPSNVTRRADASRAQLESDSKLRFAKECVEKEYQKRVRESQV